MIFGFNFDYDVGFGFGFDFGSNFDWLLLYLDMLIPNLVFIFVSSLVSMLTMTLVLMLN